MKTATELKNASISRGMPAIAKMVAKKLKVGCVFDAGSTPYADKDGIHLPKKMAACGNDNDVIILNGFLDHEAAHIRYTSFEALRLCKTPFEKTLLNIIEDIRIERLIGIAYPGCKINLAATSKLLDGEVKPNSTEPSSLVCGFLLLNLRKDVLNHAISNGHLFKYELEKVFGVSLTSQIYQLGKDGSYVSTTEECYENVAAIIELMKQKAEDQKEKDESKDESDSSDDDSQAGNSSDDDSEKSDQSKDGEDSDAGNGSGDDSEASQDADESESGNGSGDASGDSSDASQDADESDEPYQPGSGSGKSSNEKLQDATPENVDSKAIEDALNGEGEDVLADALKAAMGAMCEKTDSPAVEQIVIIDNSGTQPGPFRSNESSTGVRKISGKLDHLLWSISHNDTYTSSNGKLVASRLASVVTMKNTKIFDRTDESDGLDTAIQVMYDVSGSMRYYSPGTARYMATQASAIIAESCARYEGIECAISAFDDWIYPVKSFSEKWSKVGGRLLTVDGGNGTKMSAAHAFALGELITRKEKRKITLVITDGEPDDYPSVAASVKEASLNGIETRFVLIGYDVSKDVFNQHIPDATHVSQVFTIDDIPSAILEALKGGKGLI